MMRSPGARPMHHGRADEVGMIGEQHAGETADRPGDYEAHEPVAVGRKADGAHAPIVRPRALDDQAEAGVHQAPDEVRGGEQQGEAQIVEHGPVGQVYEPAELAAPVDGQAVIAAVARQADADVIDHLREGEGDHDEIDAARAQRKCADDEREQGRDDERHRPLHQSGAHALVGEDAHRIAADADVGGVAEAHHAAEAHDQVEAHRRQRQDDDAREQGQEEELAREVAVDGDQRQGRDERGRSQVAGVQVQVRSHRPGAGNRPSGRSTRTIAIRR